MRSGGFLLGRFGDLGFGWWYRQEIRRRDGNHELQFAGLVLRHICSDTSRQRCREKLNRDPYHVLRLLNHTVGPAGPPLAVQWLWLWITLMAAWAARRPEGPVWAGVLDTNGYPVDCTVAPPQLAGLISGSLRPMKASLALGEQTQHGVPPTAQAGAVPPMQPGTVDETAKAPQHARAAAPAPRSQAAAKPPF